jgi:hypothetical protein
MNNLNPSFYQLSTNSIYNQPIYEETHNTEAEDNEEEYYEELNDDNFEFVEFKENVKEWLTLDDDIITLQKAIKERKTRKVNLTSKIMSFMDEYKLNDLNTNNGKIKFTKSMYTKPLNKQYLISKLADYLRDSTKGEKAALFIMENREKTEKCQLRRVGAKKEINI